jgi:hypothetical protein
LVNVLVWYLPPSGGYLIPWWYYPSFVVTAVVAGAFTPNRTLWFTALCLTIPPLMGSKRQHSAPIVAFWFDVLDPQAWLQFVFLFAPVYVTYLVLIQIGIRLRQAAKAFKDGYSGGGGIFKK